MCLTYISEANWKQKGSVSKVALLIYKNMNLVAHNLLGFETWEENILILDLILHGNHPASVRTFPEVRHSLARKKQNTACSLSVKMKKHTVHFILTSSWTWYQNGRKLQCISYFSSVRNYNTFNKISLLMWNDVQISPNTNSLYTHSI